MRWALLLALLSTSALAARADRLSVSPRLDRRDRLGAGAESPILLSLSLLPPDSECSGTPPDGVTFTRASAATCISNNGQTAYNLATDQARVTSSGLLVERQTTNAILYSRDATAVVWEDGGLATNCTRTATGMDGSTQVARCAAGSIQQVLAVATGSRTASAYVRCSACLGGTATISAEGATSTPATLSGAWQRITVPYTSDGSVTVTITSDQSFDVDYAQDESGGATSPVVTAGTAATRAVEFATIPATGATPAEGCLLLTVTPTWTGATPHPSGNRFATFGSSNSAPGYSNASSDLWAAYGGAGSGPSTVAAGFTSGVAATYLTTWTVAGNQLATHNVTTSTSGVVAAYVGMSGFVSDTLDFGSGAGVSPRPNSYLRNLVLGRTTGACQ